jgi:hypothetical protein
MEKFDIHIKAKLEQTEVEPPAGFWHQISEELNEKETEAAKKPAPKIFSFSLLLKIAAVFLGVFFLGNNYISSNQEEILPLVSPNHKTTSVVESPQNDSMETNVVDVKREIINIQTLASKSKLKSIDQNTQISNNEITLIAPTDNIEESNIASEENTISNDRDFDLTESNIPVYALKLLNKNVPENDEISVIAPKTKEVQKKVIVIEKGISRQPSIDVRIPYRF